MRDVTVKAAHAPNRPEPNPAAAAPTTRRTCRLNGTAISQIEASPGHAAGIVARQACSANLRPHRVDGAGRRDADFTHERRAARTVAAHAATRIVDERTRDLIEFGFGFQ